MSQISKMSPRRITMIGFLLLATSLISLLVFNLPTASAFEDSIGSTGLHDEADVLSEEEQAEIEAAIAEVEAEGAPTVVYLRLLSTEGDEDIDDARRLMEVWDIQSEPGARDGFVMFLNLEPDDPNRGGLGLVAGDQHFDDGALPQSRLDSIRDEMIDYLADDEMAEGIVHGLEQTAEYLESGPPEPSAFETFAESTASGPVSIMNAFSLVMAMFLGIIGWRTWRDRPRAENVARIKSIEPPSNIHPAIAGALVDGSVGHQHIEATLIELVRQGALEVEPEPGDEDKIRLRVVDTSLSANAFESRLLEILLDEADGNVLDHDALVKTQSNWSEVQELVRKDLEQVGLFDPEASSHRTPLFITGVIALVLAAAAFVPSVMIEEPWGLVSVGVLGFVGAFLAGGGASYPRTTYEGERAAVPWRGYRDGLKDVAEQEYGTIDLDEAFPYIVTLNLTHEFKDHLEKASEAGYVPRWMRLDESDQLVTNNWFIYWTAFHSTANYQSPSGGGGVGGGAAAGSGGAGGRF